MLCQSPPPLKLCCHSWRPGFFSTNKQRQWGNKALFIRPSLYGGHFSHKTSCWSQMESGFPLWPWDALGQLQPPPCRKGVMCGKDHKFGFPWAEARKTATSSTSSGPPRPWMVEKHLQEKEDRKAEQLWGHSVHLLWCYRTYLSVSLQANCSYPPNQPQNCLMTSPCCPWHTVQGQVNSLKQQPEGLSAMRKLGWWGAGKVHAHPQPSPVLPQPGVLGIALALTGPCKGQTGG